MDANGPTDKQMKYILSLCGGRYDSHAFGEIARDMGVSTTAASRRATKDDASRTIERLRAQKGK